MATVIAAHAMLKSQLECSVCYQTFKDPRNLPCGHTFCLKCLQDILKAVASKNDKLPCPQCRTEVSVGSQNLQDLPKNFTVADLICALPANSQCANVEDGDQHGPAQHVCLDCWDALCLTCSNVHTKTKLTKHHTVKFLAEITTEDIQAHKVKELAYCEIHRNQEQRVTLFCEQCQRFVCNTCTGGKCKPHNCLEFSDADEIFITKINSALKPLQEINNKFNCIMKDMSSVIKQVTTIRYQTQQDIDKLLSDAETRLRTQFEQLLAKIRQCKDAAKLVVNKSHSEQMNKLKAILTDHEKQSHNIKQHQTSVEHHLTPLSSVFDRSKFIRDKLADIESETRQAKTDVSTYLLTDISQWKTDITLWLDNISDALTTATTRLPQLTEHSLVTHSVSAESQVTSAKRKRNFTVKQVKDGEYGVTTLSVSGDGQLLVGQYEDRQLHVYSGEGSHVTSINLLDGDTLFDAVWTPGGHIVYTAFNTNKVIVMTQRGDVIAQTETLNANNLSVSPDGVIYFSDNRTGFYQSTDDGVTWSHVFKVADGWTCGQVIRVSSDGKTQVFWTNEVLSADNTKWRLRACTVDKQQVIDNVTWRDITLPSHVTVNLQCTSIAFDGYTNMLVTDFDNKAVHVWTVSGQYVRKLVSSQQLVRKPYCVAVDSQRGHVMFVGQVNGLVGVFDLT